MFTGIIEGMGSITAIRSVGQARRLAITADYGLEGTRVGDSIAVSGACLTAVMISGKRFEADVSPETIDRTTFGAARAGERVNLERALRFSDRLDGHLVSGHIDGIGIIKAIGTKANATILTIGVDASLSRYMIEKGSVAVDGISLTINRCTTDLVRGQHHSAHMAGNDPAAQKNRCRSQHRNRHDRQICRAVFLWKKNRKDRTCKAVRDR